MIEGLKQLESDAIAKGKPEIQGTKTFYRHVLFLFMTLDSIMEYVDFVFSTWHARSCSIWMVANSKCDVSLSSGMQIYAPCFRWGVGHYLFKAK